LPYRILFLGTR